MCRFLKNFAVWLALRTGQQICRGLGCASLGLLLVGCANHHPSTKTHVLQLIEFKEPHAERHFTEFYRHAALYNDFKPALIVDAIALDWQQRMLYVKEIARHFFLTPTEIAQRLRMEQEAFRSQFEILIFVYEGYHRPTDLAKPQPLWRIFLRDDEGALHRPSKITRIRKNSDAYIYIQTRFHRIDRWVRLYRVSFPKLSKRVLNIPLGPKPIDLILTGVRGKLALRWKDVTLFYNGGDLPLR